MRWLDYSRHAGLAIDIAAAATLAAAVGFAVGVGTADTGLTCSAVTVAFILTLAVLRYFDGRGVGRDISAVRPAPGKPEATARGQVLRFPAAGRETQRPGLAHSVRSSRPAVVAPDARQALSDALAELRRSLR